MPASPIVRNTGQPLTEPLIEIESLSYSYPPNAGWSSREWALNDVNLAVAAGERVAILGRSGAGKTSLCLALKGIVPQLTGGRIKGAIRIGEHDPTQAAVATLADRIGMVFQEPETQFINLTVEDEIAFGLENLGLDRKEIGERLDWALALVGLDWARAFSPMELSGGEKQLAALASVVAMQPAILVLDEPVSNLDPEGRRHVGRALAELSSMAPLTIVVTSPVLTWQAELCDRVIVLDHGRVAFDGSRSALIRQVQLGELSEQAVGSELVSLAKCLTRLTGLGWAFDSVDQAEADLRAVLEGNGAPDG